MCSQHVIEENIRGKNDASAMRLSEWGIKECTMNMTQQCVTTHTEGRRRMEDGIVNPNIPYKDLPLHDPTQDHAIVLYPSMDEKETDEERKERLKGEESATTLQLLPNVLIIRSTKQERSTKHMLPRELLDQVVNHSTRPMSSLRSDYLDGAIPAIAPKLTRLKTLRVEHIALAEQDPKVLSTLIHNFSTIQELTDQEMYKTSDNLLSIALKIMELKESLPHLVSDLYVEGDLPALIFSFDRHQCEMHARKIISFLEEAEELWRTTSTKWQSKLQAWDIYESKAKDRDRIKEQAQRQRKDEDDGMNRKYRHLVEMLFRAGFLQVVIATGTLALGINTPCKTVVFSGDPYNIGKLQVGQGVSDLIWLLGKVVFHGITLDRVQRLYLLRAQL
ncbi:hypothetical protein JB92DRAFT_2829916 [Gautieria morchelliformis]|nr:hypothetical protein JB92DRAFT_2829916 [Gautieria morchelliformis]